MDVRARVTALIAGLDPTRHAAEITRLRAARTAGDLDALARAGWLTPDGAATRLRLVRHGSGTFLVVAYTDGWTETLSRA